MEFILRGNPLETPRQKIANALRAQATQRARAG
jgi:hypothetical protein